MAQNCGFFNAQYQDGEYDRVYNAEQFAAYFASFIGTGIFGDQMDELVPLARTENNMSVDISTGRAWINGWWYENDETLNLPIALADGILDRKDIIVLRWGNTERDMWLQVIQGEPSAEPVAPSIVRNADYFDLQLCTVDIPAGTTRITQSLIHDTRLDDTVCGFVFALVDQISTTALYLQFNSQFNEWFAAIQEQFEGDVPAILQAQIDDLFSIISSRIETTSTSTHAYVKDDLFIYDNKLCKASSAISIGDTIILSPTTNYNCEQTSIVDEIPLGGGGSSNEYFYNTWADAEADIANIEEGGIVYTNDGEDYINTLTLIGSQVGAGTKTVTASQSGRLLCIAKKSGKIIDSKELVISTLESGDVIPLGKDAPVIGVTPKQNLSGITTQTSLVGKELANYVSSGGYPALFYDSNDNTNYQNIQKSIGLAADLSSADDVKITYNGNRSFTLTSIAGVSVYLYGDVVIEINECAASNVITANDSDVQTELNQINTAITNCEQWDYLTAITTAGGTYSVDFTQYKAVRIISIYSGKIDSLEIYTNLLTSTALQHRMISSANDNIGAFNITNSAITELGNGAKLYVYVTK